MLAVDGISVSFGGVRAVDAVSFELGDHEILGIAGPNGSGKSTLLNALTGLLDVTGRALLDGVELDLRRPASVRRQGVLRVFQGPQTVEELSVLENLMLASPDRRGRGFGSALVGRRAMWRHERARLLDVASTIAAFDLAPLVDKEGGDLTYGQRRMVDVARAVAGHPMVLMLDEPSAGLNDAETDRLGVLLARLQLAGTAILVIDHKVDFLNRLCDRLLILQEGGVIAIGTPQEVWSHETVVEAYLGATHA